MIRRLITLSPVAFFALGGSSLAAQTWRTFDVAKQGRDSQPLSVHVSYGAGTVRVAADSGRGLYDLHLKYDADCTEPLYRFDRESHRLELGVHRTSSRDVNMKKGGAMTLALSKYTPLRLDLDIGAVEGDLALGGLRLEELAVKTGASETKLAFDQPNPLRMTLFRLDAGAANVQVRNLGNANIERIDVNLGVGQLELDFGGEWRADVDMTVNSALGSVSLTVPPDVGIRVDASTFLHSMDAEGLTKRNGAWMSDNYETARYKLRLRNTGALGRLEIKRATK